MEAALADAGLAPGDVGHVNAHGTSTPLNDAAEAAAIAKVFGAGAVPVTSTKGVTGHLIGAAGAVEAVASLLVASRTAWCRRRPTTSAPATARGRRRRRRARGRSAPKPVVSNSFGFGGHNATLVLGPA